MLRIENIKEFTDFLQKNPPSFDKNCCKKKKDIRIPLAQVFCQLFDKLEKRPVTFSEKKEEIASTRDYYAQYIKIGEVFIEYLEHEAFQKPFQEFEKIFQRIIGLNYRIQKINGGMDSLQTVDLELFSALLKKAEIFKVNQKLYQNINLTEREWSKIKEVCYYFTFGKYILKFPNLRDKFFKWCLRDNNSVATFIEFPGTAERLSKSFIDKRVGYFNPAELDIVFENQQKIIKLPFFDGEKINRINILNENQEVTLNHDRKITIKEIFDIFARKKDTPGSVEYFGSSGIMNWGSYEFGPYNDKTKTYDRIDFTKDKWWEALPVFEIISRKKLAKRYQISIEKNDWVQTVKATRETRNFELMKRHGFYEMAIPSDNDHYILFPFGKYPREFPTRLVDQLQIISSTVLATMEYPDENEFYLQRQHASYSTIIQEKEGLPKMQMIKESILAAFDKNLTFHFGGPNCAFFADELAGTSCFDMPFSQMRPSGVIQDFVLRCPLMFQPYIASFLQWFANKNGVVVTENGKSVYKSTLFGKNFNEAEQSQPAKLFQQIEEKKLNGVITFGRG